MRGACLFSTAHHQQSQLYTAAAAISLSLQEPAYWASWALTHFTSLAASSMLCALLGRAIFPLSSWGLLLAFYLLLSAALPFSYFISTWFSSSRVAGMATLLIYVLAALPG